MPRIFRHKAERGWLELRRTGAGSTQLPARVYPPKQVKDRWESGGGLQVLYELRTGEFARVDFSSDGQVLDAYQMPRKDSSDEVQRFFADNDLMVPWHLSGRT